MVDLGVLKRNPGPGYRYPGSGYGRPHVNDVEVPTVLLDGTPACWLAPIAAPGPANAEAADGFTPLVPPTLKAISAPLASIFGRVRRMTPLRVSPLLAMTALASL